MRRAVPFVSFLGLVTFLCLVAPTATAQIAPESIERLVADELRCPEGTEWEYAQSPDGEYSARWCQMTQGSQVARHGPYLELYSDGSTARQGVYLRGMQAGLWVQWTPEGQLGRYRLLAPGESSRFLPQPEDLCPAGSVRDRSTGHDHKKRMWSRCERKDDEGETVLEGPYVTWDQEMTPQGPRFKLREITTYQNGERHGPQQEFDGHFQRERLVENEAYEEGSLNGESRGFYFDGTLREVRRYEQGRFVGERVAYFADGSERWRIVYDDHGREVSRDGDFTVAGEPCTDRRVPMSSADGREDFCASRSGTYLTKTGPFVQRDASGQVVKSGLYERGEIAELWEAPPGVEVPPEVSDDVLVAEIQLMVGDEPYRDLNSPSPEEESDRWAPPDVGEPPQPPRWNEAPDRETYDKAFDEWEEAVRQWEARSQAAYAEHNARIEAEANAVPPYKIWFLNNETRKYPSPRTEVEDGVVRVYGLPPGSYYMKTEINADSSNDMQWPGDLFSSTDFRVALDEVTQTNAVLLHSLRLLEPWDNNEKIPGWGESCTSDKAVLRGPVRFAWKPPTNDVYGAVEYHYVLSRYSCDPSRELEVMAKDATTNLSVTLDLPPSRLSERYVWSLVAKRNGKAIGQMMTFGNGYGWNLGFRVQ